MTTRDRYIALFQAVHNKAPTELQSAHSAGLQTIIGKLRVPKPEGGGTTDIRITVCFLMKSLQQARKSLKTDDTAFIKPFEYKFTPYIPIDIKQASLRVMLRGQRLYFDLLATKENGDAMALPINHIEDL